jgi:hypothetical protein
MKRNKKDELIKYLSDVVKALENTPEKSIDEGTGLLISDAVFAIIKRNNRPRKAIR